MGQPFDLFLKAMCQQRSIDYVIIIFVKTSSPHKKLILKLHQFKNFEHLYLACLFDLYFAI